MVPGKEYIGGMAKRDSMITEIVKQEKHNRLQLSLLKKITEGAFISFSEKPNKLLVLDLCCHLDEQLN